jgi:hypothetical protein
MGGFSVETERDFPVDSGGFSVGNCGFLAVTFR